MTHAALIRSGVLLGRRAKSQNQSATAEERRISLTRCFRINVNKIAAGIIAAEQNGVGGKRNIRASIARQTAQKSMLATAPIQKAQNGRKRIARRISKSSANTTAPIGGGMAKESMQRAEVTTQKRNTMRPTLKTIESKIVKSLESSAAPKAVGNAQNWLIRMSAGCSLPECAFRHLKSLWQQ
jgi:hypothetical protein